MILYFDLETTGTNTEKDRIVSMHFTMRSNGIDLWHKDYLIHPTIPIPEESSKIHGIYDKDVVNMPTFGDYSQEIFTFVNGAILGGHNIINFDIPLLFNEFARSGIDWDVSNLGVVDTQKIEWAMNRARLTDCFYKYTNKQIDGAHDAKADTLASIAVAEAQAELYGLSSTDEMIAISTGENKNLDLAGKIIEVNGIATFSFGKHKGKEVYSSMINDKGWLDWFLKGDFGKNTKDIVKSILINGKK